jgi:hypothetical protein
VSYHGKRFHVPTRLTTVTCQTCEYKVDLTRHLKFPFAFGERSFPTLDTDKDNHIHDRMVHVVGMTTTYTMDAYRHWWILVQHILV